MTSPKVFIDSTRAHAVTKKRSKNRFQAAHRRSSTSGSRKDGNLNTEAPSKPSESMVSTAVRVGLEALRTAPALSAQHRGDMSRAHRASCGAGNAVASRHPRTPPAAARLHQHGCGAGPRRPLADLPEPSPPAPRPHPRRAVAVPVCGGLSTSCFPRPPPRRPRRRRRWRRRCAGCLSSRPGRHGTGTWGTGDAEGTAVDVSDSEAHGECWAQGAAVERRLGGGGEAERSGSGL